MKVFERIRRKALKRIKKQLAGGLALLLCLSLSPSLCASADRITEQENLPGEEAAAWLPEEESFVPAAALSAQDLYAGAAVLMDAKTGRVLYEKNGSKEMANASTTKILTCILILEQCDLEAVAEASGRAASQPKVHLGMRSGQRFFIRDMLYALMLESFNDCAVVLAEYAAGSVEAFAERMNEKAAEIGCEGSHFVTPNGLDGTDEKGNHHTTARDLAKIMRYCITESPKREEFLEITRTRSHSFSDAEGKRSYSCNNHNALLTMMEGALSGKTGFTNQAGYCYVGAACQGETTLIAAVLACGWPPSKNYKWVDTTKLMNYGFANFRLIEPSSQLEGLPDCRLSGYRTKRLPLAQNGQLSVMADSGERIWALWKQPDSTIQTAVSEKREEIKQKQAMGSIEYYAGGECIGSLPVEAQAAAAPLCYRDYVSAVWRFFLGY